MMKEETKGISPAIAGEVCSKETTPELKLFCDDSRPAAWEWQDISFRVFVDKAGLAWYCFGMFTCPDAIISNKKIMGCKKRNAQLNGGKA